MKLFGVLGAVGLFIGVALGAFGAHFLRGRLDQQMQAVFETGVRYQMYHSLALLAVALLVVRAPIFSYAGIFYGIGIILFSFSLYALALTGVRTLGMVTPLGGLCFLAGHLFLLFGFLRLSV
jgi:uncharacterized membrane protein YgdD (TMEM256/DUF423 family)